MACACKAKEHSPIAPAFGRDVAELTRAELSNMRLHRGAKPLRIGF